MMAGDMQLVKHLLFDAEATRGTTTDWIKEEFSARRSVNTLLSAAISDVILKFSLIF